MKPIHTHARDFLALLPLTSPRLVSRPKRLLFIAAFLGLFGQSTAQTLSFTSGSLSFGSPNTVTMNLKGVSNLMVTLERFIPSSQTWNVEGSTWLTNSGLGSYSTTVSNFYGAWRARGTNAGTTLLSTNGFLAVYSYLPNGYAALGNLVTAQSLSNLFPNPVDGFTVYHWNPLSQSTTVNTWIAGLWDTNRSVATTEGIVVYNPSTNQVTFVDVGVLNTNTFTKTLSAGDNLLTSQLYQPLTTPLWRTDLLTTNSIGGKSGLPIAFSYATNFARVAKMTNSSGTYQNYFYTNSWYTGGFPASVPLNLVEGFWLKVPTNVTWTVKRSIW